MEGLRRGNKRFAETRSHTKCEKGLVDFHKGKCIIVYGQNVFADKEQKVISRMAAQIGVSYTAMLIRLRQFNLLEYHPIEEYLDRTYICIDLKSYYASVECVHRGLDPLKANLLVADPTRSDQTICLAVSPSLKAMGVPGRPRLFEAKQAIRMYEAQHHTKVEYIIAVPRMAEYERISAKIYGIYLHYVAPEDVHVYSIDECFIDVTIYRRKRS